MVVSGTSLINLYSDDHQGFFSAFGKFLVPMKLGKIHVACFLLYMYWEKRQDF